MVIDSIAEGQLIVDVTHFLLVEVDGVMELNEDLVSILA
jgi:hypothetical protein